MASIEDQKYHLEEAIDSLKITIEHLSNSNGADQLCVGEVSSNWNYKEMIEHIIDGIILVHESYDEEEK